MRIGPAEVKVVIVGEYNPAEGTNEQYILII